MLKLKNYNLNSAIFYRGPSALDGKPIVGIICGLVNYSSNPKTGGYTAQTYILRSDISPLDAAYQDGDYSICGDCPLKPSNLNLCYVNLAKAPANVWKAFRRDRYLDLADYPLDKVGDRLLRFGAYGDPTAIPLTAWQPLIDKFAKYTGYTHQWATCDRRWQRFLMASCETGEQVSLARSQGWRTTRIVNQGDQLLDSEILCCNQSVDDIALKPQCEQCGLCDGTRGGHSKDIAFLVHGARSKHFKTEPISFC